MGTTQATPVDPVQATRELTKPGPGDKSIKGLLSSKQFQDQVAMALPRHLKPERFIRVALNATLQKPELLECDRNSFFLALLQLSSYGLEADGRRAHLIPFTDHQTCTCGHKMDIHNQGKCQYRGGCGCVTARKRKNVQLILDYKGLAELVRRSGDVSYIHADVVLDGDEWDFQYGSESFVRHKPNLELGPYRVVESGGARIARKIVAFYSYVKLKDGTEDFIVMSKGDVDEIRKRSKAADSGPWVTDYLEMGKKTVFRRHSKWLPLSPEVQDAINSDDEEGHTIDASMVLDGAMSIQPEEDEPEPKEETLADRVAAKAGQQTPTPEVKTEAEPKQEAAPETAEPAKKNPPKKLYDYLDWDSAAAGKDYDKDFVKVQGIVYQNVDGNWQPWKG